MHRLLFLSLLLVDASEAFCSTFQQRHPRMKFCAISHNSQELDLEDTDITRRTALRASIISPFVFLFSSRPAYADKSFAPGGTLVDYEVGVQVTNPQASASRKADNSNVIFNQDYYFKFGTAAPWSSDEFPKTMPFTPSQQRYEQLKKYRDRVQRGVDLIASLKEAIQSSKWSEISGADAPEYSIRPMGLLANGFLASENTGTTNELLLARWYINEMYLDIGDIQAAGSKKDAQAAYATLLNALNSYLGMLNRVITPKVGDKFALLSA